jgi:hypothetical protein
METRRSLGEILGRIFWETYWAVMGEILGVPDSWIRWLISKSFKLLDPRVLVSLICICYFSFGLNAYLDRSNGLNIRILVKETTWWK